MMGSSVVVSLGFPTSEDTGEGTRDVHGGGGVRGVEGNHGPSGGRHFHYKSSGN